MCDAAFQKCKKDTKAHYFVYCKSTGNGLFVYCFSRQIKIPKKIPNGIPHVKFRNFYFVYKLSTESKAYSVDSFLNFRKIIIVSKIRLYAKSQDYSHAHTTFRVGRHDE